MQSRALASAWRCMGVSRGGRVGERPGRGNGVTESTQAALGSCQRRAPFARKGGVAYDAARLAIGRAPSDLQSLMRTSYAVFRLMKKNIKTDCFRYLIAALIVIIRSLYLST